MFPIIYLDIEKGSFVNGGRAAPIPEFQEKSPFMAAVGNMPYVSRNVVSISSRQAFLVKAAVLG